MLILVKRPIIFDCELSLFRVISKQHYEQQGAVKLS